MLLFKSQKSAVPARTEDTHEKALEYEVLMQRQKRLAAAASAINLARSVEEGLEAGFRED